MTATYDDAEVERMIAEARTFGARDRQGFREGMADQLESARARIAELETAPSTASDLTACEEQRDVYRDRAQQLAGRVIELTTALRSLIARVRRIGGYASPEEQAALWEAERVLGDVAGGVDGDMTRQTNAE